MDDWRKNIYFVLVEPTEPGNIGASARAIKNMGFRNLCLVNPPVQMTDEARWFARNAQDVLDSAEIFDSVSSAVRDKAIIVGTTRREGKRRGIIFPVEKGAERIYNLSAHNKVAILFGREARGLFNNEVDECGFMIRIPSSELQPSLNLSQAVLIMAYELFKSGPTSGSSHRGSRRKKCDNSVLMDDLAAHAELGPLYERISQVLELLEYMPRGDMDLIKKIIVNLKHFIGRAGITEKELNMLLGICTQIEKKLPKR